MIKDKEIFTIYLLSILVAVVSIIAIIIPIIVAYLCWLYPPLAVVASFLIYAAVTYPEP